MRRTKKINTVFVLAVVIALLMNTLGIAVFAEDQGPVVYQDGPVSGGIEQIGENTYEVGDIDNRLDVITHTNDSVTISVGNVNSDNIGVDLNIQGGGDVTVSTGDIVSVAPGVDIYGSGDGEIVLTTGDIHATQAPGLNVENYSNNITIDAGEITSDTNNGVDVHADSDTDPTEKMNITTGSVTGANGVYLEAGTDLERVDPGIIIMEVNGDVTGTQGSGAAIYANDKEGYAELTVNGSVEGYNTGLKADNISYYPGDEAEITVKVTEDVKGTGGDGSLGLDVNSSGGKIDISVDGSVDAGVGVVVTLVDNSALDISQSEQSEIYLLSKENVDGYPIVIPESDDEVAYYINDNGEEVPVLWDEDKEIYTDSEGNKVIVGIYEEQDEESGEWSIFYFLMKNPAGASSDAGCTNISVDGNVTGSMYGLVARSEDVFMKPVNEIPETLVADVLVAETLSGDTVSVALDDSVTAENLKLTVWEVTLNENGNAAESLTDDYQTAATDASAEFEKTIRYIIKVEPLYEGGTLSAVDADGNALETSHDYDVALEGDKVVLKVELEKGYKVVGAYNGKGEKVELLTDEDGNYYVIVPKGGAVYLSAEVEKEKYDITYDLDGGVYNGGTDAVVVNYEYGSVISILDAPTKEGFKFLYWKGSEYNPGDSYTVEGAHKFTAIWELVEEESEEPTVTPDPTPADYVAPTPKTGDSSGLGAWIVLMTVSGLAAAEMFIFRKRFSE